MPSPYYYGVTNIGLRRENNEDTIVIKPADKLWVVADGMGGHASGEVASAIAGDTIAEDIRNGVSLVEAIQNAHAKIVEASHKGIGQVGMGSTVVALKSNGVNYQVAWVGDSRAYLWSQADDGPLFTQLTVDHSYVQMLFESGAISEDEMSTHPEKNIITQCLGSTELNRVKVDQIEREWEKDDTVLLCSDGLTDAVDNQTICNILARGKDVQDAADDLVQAALSHGGRDNISVVLVRKPVSGLRQVLSSLIPS